MKLRYVLSFFDGMSCGRVALDRAKISYERYFAAEIDKFAIQVSQKNYPDTTQLGDVVFLRKAITWKEETAQKFYNSPYIRSEIKQRFKKLRDINWALVDLFIGGSPCQGFSFAGKQLNFNDPRSMLFFEYVKVLNHIKKLNPKVKFFLENVVMKQEYQNIISQFLGVEPVLINSALVSAQNRERLYWTNISYIPQPKDREIYLKDILQPEHEVDEKYYIKNIDTISFFQNNIDNSNKLGYLNTDSQGQRVYKIDGKSVYLNAQGGGWGTKTGLYAIKIDKKGKIKNNQGKASCLTGGGNSGGNHSDMDLLYVREATKQGYCEIAPGECVDLTQLNSKTRRGRKMAHKSSCLTAGNFEFCYYDGYRIRRLTEIECERLQTAIDNYTSGVSSSQRYKMLGNGWTIEVIVWILSFLKNPIERKLEFQPDMFGFSELGRAL